MTPCASAKISQGFITRAARRGFQRRDAAAPRAWYNNLVMSKMTEAGPDSRYLHTGPMFHLADGCASGGLTAVGATHVYIPMFDIDGVLDTVETHGVTHTLMVPTMIGMLLGSDKFDPARLASLKYLTYGASPMPEGLLVDLIKRLPDLNIIQGYGQTELAPIVTTCSPNIMCWGAIIPNCARRASGAGHGGQNRR